MSLGFRIALYISGYRGDRGIIPEAREVESTIVFRSSILIALLECISCCHFSPHPTMEIASVCDLISSEGAGRVGKNWTISSQKVDALHGLIRR